MGPINYISNTNPPLHSAGQDCTITHPLPRHTHTQVCIQNIKVGSRYEEKAVSSRNGRGAERITT